MPRQECQAKFSAESESETHDEMIILPITTTSTTE